MNNKDFKNKCFSPNWIEINLDEVNREVNKEVNNLDQTCPHTIKEERLENKRRKDLNTLLRELDEIKQNIEWVAEKQHRLANIMSFYTGEFAQ